ncbi:asparagine synthase-related protein, partial [Xanthomonas citri pv. citri]
QIGNYLLGRFDDKTSTFYQSVRRLSPASWIEIEEKQGSELRENIYWELDGERELLLPSDEDYAALLREKFTESVRQRMRSNGKFAVFLSGGLDSSSIAAVAEREAEPHQKPVPAMSTVFERFAECDERQYINQTLARGEFEPIW